MTKKFYNGAMILTLVAMVTAIILRRTGFPEHTADVIRDGALLVFSVVLVVRDKLIGGSTVWQCRWYVVLVVMAGLNFCGTLFFR